VTAAERAYIAYNGTPREGFLPWANETTGKSEPPAFATIDSDEREAWEAVASALEPRDGITVADDDGTEVVFNINLVMHVKTQTDETGRYTVGEFPIHCGGSKPVAYAYAAGVMHTSALGKQIREAVEDYLEKFKPEKGRTE